MSPLDLPPTIRAWQYTSTKNGLENNLRLNNVKTPQASPNQNLVRVTAIALNPVDYKPREHPLVGRLLFRKPSTPGLDMVGKIIQPAQGSSFEFGQLVYGVAGTSPFNSGGLREICITETDHTIPVPEGVAPLSATTIPVAGLSAYQTIVPNVKAGDRVFINGGSGGTGVFGIQIAKAVGCSVTTTCSTRNIELCKSLGADEVVDYTKGDIVGALKKMEKFDLVVDNAGGNSELYWRCHEYTQEKAKYIMVAGELTLGGLAESMKMRWLPTFLGGGRREISGFWPHADLEHLQQIGSWMKEGKVKPFIDEIFKFEDAPKAFAKLKTGRARGKIIVEVGKI